jgi:protein-tyrosine-phosphatase
VVPAAEAEERARVLFLCTHNSARSQMAEGLLRHLAGNGFEVHSASTEATVVRPLAIRAMDEVGVDITGQESKIPERYLGEPFDYVITVCDDTKEACPFLPSAKTGCTGPWRTPLLPRAQWRGGWRSSGGYGTRSGSALSRSS